MKVALIGDVHANLPALEAVLAHARSVGIEAIWNVGDLVGYGPFPDETVRCLRQCDATSILGNYDAKVLRGPRRIKARNPLKALAFRWAYEHLSHDSRTYLASLPLEIRMEAAGRRVLLTHGSPGSPDEHLSPDTPRERFRELAKAADADIVVCGHSHRPFSRRAGGVWFINTGSVGRPDEGDPRACYALLEVCGQSWRCRHIRLDYDIDRTARTMREKRLPEMFTQMILQGRALDVVVANAEDGAHGQPTDAPAKGPKTAAGDAVADETSGNGSANPMIANHSWDNRFDDVLRLAGRCDYEQGHTHQVAGLTLRLFDELQALHNLGDQERFWLACGALLHDIGWIEGRPGHHKTSMRIILDASLPVLDDRQRRIVACIARYHRRAEPKLRHAVYGELRPEDRDIVRTLAAILRVADALDVMHEDRIAELRVSVSAGRIVLHCRSAECLDEERKQVRKKGDLFEDVFRRKLEIQWHHG